MLVMSGGCVLRIVVQGIGYYLTGQGNGDGNGFGLSVQIGLLEDARTGWM
jgi:hypothetical protein